MEYYLYIKKNEIMKVASKCIKVEPIIMSNVIQTPPNIPNFFLHVYVNF